MLAVAESGLGQISEILIEMKAKATAAASETLGTEERAAIKSQMESLGKQINDIVSETSWNGDNLLDGTVSKSLQTGAGANDQTAWDLAANHSATAAGGLGIGQSSAGATVTETTVLGDAFGAGAVAVGGTAHLAALSQSAYEFEVLDTATSTTVGKATALETNDPWAAAHVLGNSAAPSATQELASGNYTLKVIDNTVATFEFEIRDEYGSLVAQNTGVSVVNIAAGPVDLDNDAGEALGITLDGSAGAMANGDTYDFEYIAMGEVKVELNKITISGAAETSTVQTVDADGIDGTNDPVRTSFYVAAAGTYDTGRGFQVTMGAFADIDANDKTRFDLTEAGAVSITLSTAADATTLMGTLDTALSTVTASLNSVGSLVARLDKKESAVSVSQVNTEAAYNRIMNADMAYEQVQASKYQILQQTAMAMLSQANMAPQGILSLFR